MEAPERSTTFANLTPLGVLNSELDRVYAYLSGYAAIDQRNDFRPCEAVGLVGGIWVRASAGVGGTDAAGVVVSAGPLRFVVGVSGMVVVVGHGRTLGEPYFLSRAVDGLAVTPEPGPGGRTQRLFTPIDKNRLLLQVSEGIEG